MKKVTLAILIVIFSVCFVKAQTDCEKAVEQAKKDYEKSSFAFHSEEILPVENTYFYVLKNYYDVDWYFTDSTDYYACYDSIMVDLLKRKYGSDFLQKARAITDSLEKTEYWRKDASFYGGKPALSKFLSNWTINNSMKIDTIKTKYRLYIKFEIDSTGEVKNPEIVRGINKKVDKKIIEIVSKMPKWEPAYLYGKSTRQIYTMPIYIDQK